MTAFSSATRTLLGSTTILILLFSVYACGDDSPSGPDADNFDREAILVNWADNIILPSLQAYQSAAGDLQAAATAFAEDPAPQTLDELRSAWQQSYLAWQHVSVYQMIDDTQFQFRNRMNIYPTDTEGIHNNISQGEYNLQLPSQFDRQGLPALDYLLHGVGETDEAILNVYTTGDEAGSYREYLLALVNRIEALTTDVLNHWNETYRDQFVSNSGRGANASLDMMVNNYIYYYEKHLRAGKIGIPAGVLPQSSSQQALRSPHRVEAYYSRGFSKALFLEALDAAQGFFNGRHVGSQQTGESLATYLDYLNEIKDGADLNERINNQFDAVRAKGETLLDDFAEQVDTDHVRMLETYDELQKNVVYMKTDMTQALNVSITYVDADGD